MHDIDPSQPLIEVPYPPAPWRVRGQAWGGLLRTNSPIALPAGLLPLLGRRWLIVALVRYLDGPLQYDELLMGPPVRRGRQIGMWVERIWVDDLASLWGGRRIWGLPKELARFDWSADTVRITDAVGPVATLVVRRRMAWSPPLPAAVAGFGRLGAAWTLVPAGGWVCPGLGGLEIHNWSSRLPRLSRSAPLFAFTANPFIATIAAPSLNEPQ